MTINAIMSIYKEVYMKTNLKPSTYNGYSVNIDNHILPVLGNKDSEELEYKDIDSLVEKMAHEKLKNTTIRYALRVLKQALKFAQKRKYILCNIMDSYDMPRKNKYNHTVLSEAEISKLYEYIFSTDSDIKLCVLLATFYGLRRGECLGLKYSDLNGNILRIRRTSQLVHSEFLTTDCKTENSRRDILLTQEHIDIIKEYHMNREKNPDGFLMRKADGQRITQNMLQREFKLVLKRLKLPDIRIHDLRHPYVKLRLKNLEPTFVWFRLKIKPVPCKSLLFSETAENSV